MSRPTTPESLLTNSFYHATSTIDDLTVALTNFSRVPSPEPPSAVVCCCGDGCENLKSWMELRSRLNSRLILSAEVGQALLQRHEAYVRQNERRIQIRRVRSQPESEDAEGSSDAQISNEMLQRDYDDLAKEKAHLEKTLNQALVNNEVTEVSNKTILQELQEARETVSRLTAHHARSVGWDTRLSAAMKERDDMQQERDGETHRARLAESRFAALKDKTAKLQAEVRRLQASLEEKRQSRLKSSETLLQDARSRLESFRNSQLGVTAKVEEEGLTDVLESLVNDNEILKKDNAELQHLLAESREDLHGLQEEVEEQRANQAPLSRSGANTPQSRHNPTNSVPSISLKDYTLFSPTHKGRRHPSIDQRNGRPRLSPSPVEPSTPDTTRSPISPTDSLAPSDAKWAAFGQISPRYPSSHVSFEIEEDAEDNGSSSEFERPRTHKPLILLTRSRGVQADELQIGLSPSPFPSQLSSATPNDLQSESSSYSDSISSHITIILERVSTLYSRLSQADALTLTNRLKRQHLKGADVGHLSRSTVNNILSEATGLRGQFRGLLEDDKAVTSCTRKDLRTLFKLIKDIFTEMGQLRVTLNDIILDPGSALRISEITLNPGKAEAELREKESLGAGAVGWMAPISKLFSPTGRTDPAHSSADILSRSTSGRTPAVRVPRFVPKLGPALAASATTVNVEFSGTGVGRSVTSTFSAQPLPVSDSSTSIMTVQSTAPSLMGIFAGAPQNPVPLDPDPWVVLPSGPSHVLRKSRSFMKLAEMSTATIGRNSGRRNVNRLSRNVDAVIDVQHPREPTEVQDFVPPLLERTLRRRGLSDSSIHSTFASHGEGGLSPTLSPSPARPAHHDSVGPSSRLPAWPDRASVLQALTRTMQNIRATAAATIPPLTSAPTSDNHQPFSPATSSSPPQASLVSSVAPPGPAPITSPPLLQTPRRNVQPKPARVTSSNGGDSRIPWAAHDDHVDPMAGADPFIASSLRDESLLQRIARTHGTNDGSHGHEFF